MTAKEYLSQAYQLDQRINTKLDQVSSLNELAEKCTSVITDMPHNPGHGVSAMADNITKIVDLQADINDDIDELIDLKRAIAKVIKSVSNPEYQMILEKRYLCYLHWDQIAADLNHDLRYLHKLHGRALCMVTVPQTY